MEKNDLFTIDVSKYPDVSENNRWQRCPICSGMGRLLCTDGMATFKPCDVCNGKKIISTVTGKPPAD